MHRIFRVKAYEKEHGPHFNEEYARKAVMKMENEDGTRGPHWSLEETTTLASQYGIALGSKFNRYDWFVALNMVYSDYYRVIMNITGSNNTKHYVEFAKAWLNDKDVDEGKMWYYYIYVMCDHIREAEDVDGIKCKLPNTVSVPYPQLSVYNPEIFRAAAYGAFAGDTYANYGLSSQCGC